jgi:hypothetical protein
VLCLQCCHLPVSLLLLPYLLLPCLRQHLAA